MFRTDGFVVDHPMLNQATTRSRGSTGGQADNGGISVFVSVSVSVSVSVVGAAGELPSATAGESSRVAGNRGGLLAVDAASGEVSRVGESADASGRPDLGSSRLRREDSSEVGKVDSAGTLATGPEVILAGVKNTWRCPVNVLRRLSCGADEFEPAVCDSAIVGGGSASAADPEDASGVGALDAEETGGRVTGEPAVLSPGDTPAAVSEVAVA